MSGQAFFGLAALLNVLSVVVLAWTVRERRRIERQRTRAERAWGHPLDASRVDEARRRLRR